MEHTRFVKLREEPRWLEAAAAWFHQKWGIPQEAYRASMEACLAGQGVPQWYLAVEGERILGGLGGDCKRLPPRRTSPPMCAPCTWRRTPAARASPGRCWGWPAGTWPSWGTPLVPADGPHTAFYERYGWEYLCPVRGDGEAQDSRMYIHRQTEK